MKTQDVFTRHQIKIALSTLRMSDAGAFIMGGMSKGEAREVLSRNGYGPARIAQIEGTLWEQMPALRRL